MCLKSLLFSAIIYCLASSCADAQVPAVHGASADKGKGIRQSYAKAWEKRFLERGIDMMVAAFDAPLKDGGPGDKAAHPRLFLLGYINKPFVYNAIARGDILRAAQQAGFKSVHFSDRGDDGAWLFDLSAGIPKCDTHYRLCL